MMVVSSGVSEAFIRWLVREKKPVTDGHDRLFQCMSKPIDLIMQDKD